MTPLRHRFLVPGLVTGLLTLAVPAPLFAQEADRLAALARDAAARFAAERIVPLQAAAVAQAPAAAATIHLTLDDATQRALERNLDIAVERLNPQTFDFSIAALNANYRPTLTTTTGLRHATTFSRSQTAGAAVLETGTLTGNSGIAQNLRVGGGSFSLTFNNNRVAQSDQFALRNPTLGSSINAVMIQPLLRGFRIDNTRSQLLITRINQDMSDLAVRGVVVTTLANVRNGYWDLVYAIQAVDAATRSLALASKLVDHCAGVGCNPTCVAVAVCALVATRAAPPHLLQDRPPPRVPEVVHVAPLDCRCERGQRDALAAARQAGAPAVARAAAVQEAADGRRQKPHPRLAGSSVSCSPS